MAKLMEPDAELANLELFYTGEAFPQEEGRSTGSAVTCQGKQPTCRCGRNTFVTGEMAASLSQDCIRLKNGRCWVRCVELPKRRAIEQSLAPSQGLWWIRQTQAISPMCPLPSPFDQGHDVLLAEIKEIEKVSGTCARRPPSMAALLAVLESARKIEGSFLAVIAWYRDVAIAELDGCTARELVAKGRAEEVIEFLRAIQQGKRD